MRRLRAALPLAIALLLVLAPMALAHDGGQGTFGEADDKAVTYAAFITIAFFPLLIFVLTVIQSSLDKRKHRRMDAKRARATSADWRGGW
ncbi:MAG TPA: hypothetical protein VGI54_09735 [Solirubrobacteraceae bacterium]